MCETGATNYKLKSFHVLITTLLLTYLTFAFIKSHSSCLFYYVIIIITKIKFSSE